MLWLALSPQVRAATLEVGADREFPDPAAALSEARGGDRILIWPGEYGPVVVDLDVEIAAFGAGTVTLAARGGPAVEVRPLASVTLRGLVLDGAGEDRALRIGAGAEVVVEDALVRGGSARIGGCVHADAASVTLRRATIEGCAAESGGGLYGTDSVVIFDAVTVSGSVATSGFGGGVGLERSGLVARGVRFEGNVADDPVGDPHGRGLGGGLFIGSDSTLELRGSVFSSNEARSVSPEAGRGGAIRLWTTRAEIEGVRFEGNAATAYGSAVAAASSEVWLSGSAAIGNGVDGSEALGGTVFCDELSGCVVHRAWFEGNTSGDGGGIGALGELTVTTSMFCDNVASGNGGAIDVGDAGEPGRRVRVSGSVIARNVAGGAGGGIAFGEDPIELDNDHLVANQATVGAAAAGPEGFFPLGGGSRSVGNLIAGNQSVSGPVLEPGVVFGFVERYDWFDDNEPSSLPFWLGTGSGEGDPGLVGPVSSCDGADLVLGPSSPLRDAGDPDAAPDADGTRNDIGAFGGPDGDPGAFVDADGDGRVAMVDCDDGNGAISPDAAEVCNGIDDDCDGLVDEDDLAVDAGWLFEDLDGDGLGGVHAAYACPGPGRVADGTDCDDTDAAIRGPVPWYVDADGDGHGDPASGVVGCEGPPGAVLLGDDCDDDDPRVGGGCGPLVDSDGDGVVDAVDPAPTDAGGVRVAAPTPAAGFGCATGSPEAGLWALLALGLAAARRARA